MPAHPDRDAAPANPEPTLALEGVTVRLGRRSSSRELFDALSVSFQPSKMTAITGPSGSGKSTLLHVAAGLRAPTTGRVLFDGRDLTSLSERQRSRIRRDNFGFVFQSYNLMPSLTVHENVALPLRLRRDSSFRARATSALEAVELVDYQRAYPAHLSGGQAQRVAIARALATRPRVEAPWV